MEVLNTGFYKVYTNIKKFDRSKATLYTWIRTILINCCLDHIRSKQSLINAGELEQAADIHVPPVAITGMSAAQILKWVRELPPATQAVFNLYVTEGYTHKEIAQMMKISDGTSKWHLSEARKLLQKKINEQGKG
jgi:RNA polymerase sigma-70 factor (ECF subfamily)